MRRIAAHQPNFMPWLGYFAKMVAAEEIVFLDDVQMPQGRSYVSRSMVRTQPDAASWLSVPVKRASGQRICDVEIAEPDWHEPVLQRFRHAYRRAPFFATVMPELTEVLQQPREKLVAVNLALIDYVRRACGIECKLSFSSTFELKTTGEQRIVELVLAAGGDVYISGDGATAYQSTEYFDSQKVGLKYLSFKPPDYDVGEFKSIAGLSAVDALFLLGPTATRRMIDTAVQGTVDGALS
jgi:WbqC-like protein family